jgi:transketolase
MNISKQKSKEIRDILYKMCCKVGCGHISSANSCVDILVALYYGVLNWELGNPDWPDRDRFILSKGHAGVALYPILADLQYFPKGELDKFCAIEGILGGHPGSNIPGVEVSSGSLGHGLSIGCGMALAAKMDRKLWMTFVLMGDGECQEGSIWEAAMFASHHRLNNLVGIIDRNYMGATDFTENSLTLEPLYDKWKAFGWDATVVDGHNVEGLIEILQKTRGRHTNKPKMIIAETIKGYGIDFMEYDPSWHARCPK